MKIFFAILLRACGTLIAAAMLLTSATPASAQVSFALSVNIGPPAIPYYVQPAVVVQNDIWMPGYWAWGQAGYYWVPGTWVAAPAPGLLWTPGYWSANGANYGWTPGYWGSQVGYYGGINYGGGYYGNGYAGGRWSGNSFGYNTAVSNVNRTYVRNVYVNTTVVNNTYTGSGANRVAYYGGNGGTRVGPTAAQRTFAGERHTAPTAVQNAHIQMAGENRNALANVNQGRPQEAAIAKPLSAGHGYSNAAAVTSSERQSAQTHVVALKPQQQHAAAAPQQHAAAAPQQHAAAAPQQHAAAPQQHAAAPQQHAAAAPQQHVASAPQQHAAAAPQQHVASAPQQHAAAAPQQHAQAPQQHAAAAPQQHAQAPQQHAVAAPQQHAQAPQQHAAETPGEPAHPEEPR